MVYTDASSFYDPCPESNGADQYHKLDRWRPMLSDRAGVALARWHHLSILCVSAHHQRNL